MGTRTRALLQNWTSVGREAIRHPAQPYREASTIVALNGLRGAAILWIVVYHIDAFLPNALQDASLQAVIKHFAWQGPLGVDILFMVSGFVLWRNYSERLARLASRSYRVFLQARLARIYPVYFVFLTISIVGVAVMAPADTHIHRLLAPWPVIANYLLIQTWVGAGYIVGAAWALSALFGMYVIFPILVPVLRLLQSTRVRVLVLALLFAGPFLAFEVVPGRAICGESASSSLQTASLRCCVPRSSIATSGDTLAASLRSYWCLRSAS